LTVDKFIIVNTQEGHLDSLRCDITRIVHNSLSTPNMILTCVWQHYISSLLFPETCIVFFIN